MYVSFYDPFLLISLSRIFVVFSNICTLGPIYISTDAIWEFFTYLLITLPASRQGLTRILFYWLETQLREFQISELLHFQIR